MNCSLFSIRRYQYPQPHFKSMHNHTFFEVNLYSEGSGNTVIGSKCYDFSDSTIAIIPPNMHHSEDYQTPGSVTCLLLETDSIPLTGDAILLQPDADSSIFTYTNMMVKENNRQDEYHSSVLQHLLHVFLSELSRLMSAQPSSNRTMEYIRSYINENFYRKLSFTELADMSGYSYDYFRHSFKKEYGVSPQTYLIQLRLETARSVLSSSPDTSITEVAETCGFADCSQFSAMFTKQFGTSPKRFQKAAKEQYLLQNRIVKT